MENNEIKKSDKPLLQVFLIWFVLGFLGLHRFFVGRFMSGIMILFLLFIGVLIPLVWLLLGFWLLVDGILILFGKFKDSKGLPIIWK